MKLLFTADLHIKLGQKNVPIDWARDRYHKLFQQLSYHSGQAALTVIGGDIFDKVPSMEELELYFYMLEHLNSPSVIYSGNHEAVKKNTTFLTNLKRASVFMNNKYKVTVIDDFATIMGIDFIQYTVHSRTRRDSTTC
jgi:DNA repair exonuclease SbcCD nuclease subunit